MRCHGFQLNFRIRRGERKRPTELSVSRVPAEAARCGAILLLRYCSLGSNDWMYLNTSLGFMC